MVYTSDQSFTISALSETKCWIVQLTQLEMPGHIHCSEPTIQVNIKTTSSPSNTHLLALTVVIIASLGQSLAGTFSYLGHLAQGLVTNPPVTIYYFSNVSFSILHEILLSRS